MKSIRMLAACATMLVFATSALHAQGGKVTCKDGSPSAGGRGACSSHGGILTAAEKTKMKADAKVAKAVDKAADKKEKAEARMVKVDTKADAKVAKVEAKAAEKMDKAEDHEMKGAIAECRDHTYSHAKSRRGVCSSHGGVAKFLVK